MKLKNIDVDIIKCPVCKANQFKPLVSCLRCGTNLTGASNNPVVFNNVQQPPVAALPAQILSSAAPTVVNLEDRPEFTDESVYSRPTQLLEPVLQNSLPTLPPASGRFPFLLAGATLFVLLVAVGVVIILVNLNVPSPVYSDQAGVVTARKPSDSTPLPQITPPGVNLQVPTTTIQPSTITNPTVQLSAGATPSTTSAVVRAGESATPAPSATAKSPASPAITERGPTGTPVPNATSLTPGPTGFPAKISANLLAEKVVKQETGQNNGIAQVAFSPDGQKLATGAKNGDIELWSVPGLNSLGPLKSLQKRAIYSLAFSPQNQGALLASSGAGNSIEIWDIATLKEKRVIITPAANVNAIAFSPDGTRLASGGDDNQVYIWDVETGGKLAQFPGHQDAIQSLVFFSVPGGHYLASGSDDKTIKIWDLQLNTLATTLESHTDSIYQVAFSPASNLLASSSLDGSIKLWDWKTATPAQTLSDEAPKVYSVSFSPYARFLASGNSDKSVILWDTATGKVQQKLSGFDNLVNSVAFSQDGKYLAAGSFDGRIRIYSITYQ